MLTWIKVVAPLVLAAGLFGAGAFWGQSRGMEVAQERHQDELAQLRESAKDSMETQRIFYEEEIDHFLEELRESEAANARIRQREARLSQQLTDARDELSDLQGQIYETDVGTCNVSSGFDRLLINATSPARDRTAEAGTD